MFDVVLLFRLFLDRVLKSCISVVDLLLMVVALVEILRWLWSVWKYCTGSGPRGNIALVVAHVEILHW